MRRGLTHSSCVILHAELDHMTFEIIKKQNDRSNSVSELSAYSWHFFRRFCWKSLNGWHYVPLSCWNLHSFSRCTFRTWRWYNLNQIIDRSSLFNENRYFARVCHEIDLVRPIFNVSMLERMLFSDNTLFLNEINRFNFQCRYRK